MNIAVKENSPDKLRLTLHPTACFLVGGGALFTGLGLLVIWLLGDSVRLTVDEHEVRYQRLFLGQKIRKEFTIANEEISDITLELKEGFSPTYKVTLHTTDQSFEVDLPMSDGDQKRALIDQLKAEIQEPGGRAGFTFEESGVIGGLLMGGACIVAGLICLYSLQTVVVTANREIGYLQIRRRRTLLPFGDQREIELEKFRSIKAKKHTTTNARGITTTSYQVVIRERGGGSLDVAHGPMFTEQSSTELVRLVENWVAERISQAGDEG